MKILLAREAAASHGERVAHSSTYSRVTQRDSSSQHFMFVNCADSAYAQFTSAPAGLGITDGVLLTSGSAIEVNQNNDIFFNPQASNDNGLFGDPDLDASLSGGLISTDACVLVFDITVFGDTLKFDYRFGSEEYENFVCDAYNDVFGFYVSGANPAGGNYNQQNIVHAKFLLEWTKMREQNNVYAVS